ncbi:MAG: general secretion pathway protein GspK [Deltaproteobacteria bacterium]|nr:general secretion pathway protein GspK [Deltaproteobacteria bacterium]
MAAWGAVYRPFKDKRRRRVVRGRPIVDVARPVQPTRKPRRGAALIMVLLITVILSAIAADLVNGSHVNVQAAANARDELQAYFHARSALELELFVLRFQGLVKKQLEGFIPVPLFELSGFLVSSDTMKGVLERERTPTDASRSEAGGSGRDDDDEGKGRDRDKNRDEKKRSGSGDSDHSLFATDQPFGDFEGSFSIEEVVDENRKINLNAVERFGIGCQDFLHAMIAAVLSDPRYDPLFEAIGDTRDPLRTRVEIISNLTDWVDGNDTINTVCFITGERDSQISEDTRYDHLPYNAHYKPKNGMFNSLAELRLVPGINDAFMRLFAQYFTVWSDSGVSVKTASQPMLRAIILAVASNPPLPGDEVKYEKFFSELALATAMPGVKMSQSLFETLLTTAEIPYDKKRLSELVRQGAITFDDVSSVYRITAVGRVHGASSKITAVWRDDRTGRLSADQFYYWREE